MSKLPKMPKIIVSLRSIDFKKLKRQNTLTLDILVHFSTLGIRIALLRIPQFQESRYNRAAENQSAD